MFEVRILNDPAKELKRLDKSIALRVVTKIKWLADNIEFISPIKLSGDLSNPYKLRIGDYRVIYDLLPDEEILIIHFIGHRRDVYKKK